MHEVINNDIDFLNFSNEMTNSPSLDEIMNQSFDDNADNDNNDVETGGMYVHNTDDDTVDLLNASFDDNDDYDHSNKYSSFSSQQASPRRRIKKTLVTNEQNVSTSYGIIDDSIIDNGHDRYNDSIKLKQKIHIQQRHHQELEHECFNANNANKSAATLDTNTTHSSSWRPSLSTSFLLPFIHYSSEYVMNTILGTTPGQKEYNTSSKNDVKSNNESNNNSFGKHKEQEASSSSTTSTTNEFTINFRPILPKDRIVIQSLHEEWFPVRYHDEFYDDLVYNRFHNSKEPLYTCIATTTKILNSTSNNISISSNPNNNNSESESVTSDIQHHQIKVENVSHQSLDENLLQNYDQMNDSDAIQSPLHHPNENINDNNNDDDEIIIACVVGSLLQDHQVSVNTRELLMPINNLSYKYRSLFYIMTLGTCNEYRNIGLGSILINKCIEYAENNNSCSCGIIYLHVIVTNIPAIKFYEKLHFIRITEIKNYYTIDNQYYNCYLYAKYINGTYILFVGFCIHLSLIRSTTRSL